MAHEYLDILRAECGRARKISRAQLQATLLKMADQAELPLRAYAAWYGVTDDAPLDVIAKAIANAPRGITLVSLGGQVRDIQYDQPGSMNPSQYAEISFVSEELRRGDYDHENDPGNTMAYLRRHARRVVIVTGEFPKSPKEADEDTWLVECDRSHKWRIPKGPHSEELDRCPKCGDYWQ